MFPQYPLVLGGAGEGGLPWPVVYAIILENGGDDEPGKGSYDTSRMVEQERSAGAIAPSRKSWPFLATGKVREHERSRAVRAQSRGQSRAAFLT
jgi:hypothetical protein